jgi:hypothetical protein
MMTARILLLAERNQKAKGKSAALVFDEDKQTPPDCFLFYA